MNFKKNLVFYSMSEAVWWLALVADKLWNFESKENQQQFELSQKDKKFLATNVSSSEYRKILKNIWNLSEEHKQAIQEKWLKNLLQEKWIQEISLKNIKQILGKEDSVNTTKN